jgi:hypothetical protein
MKSVGEMSRAELAALVQEKLRVKGIDEILSGGSCVSIYSDEQYVSMDLDMIHTSLLAPKREIIREALQELGFSEEGRYFRHPESEIFVEFPPGPPSVGEEPVGHIVERREITGILRLLSPTECVKDRLASYYYFNDEQCLQQAVLVYRENRVDLDEVERWSLREGEEGKFRRFEKFVE